MFELFFQHLFRNSTCHKQHTKHAHTHTYTGKPSQLVCNLLSLSLCLFVMSLLGSMSLFCTHYTIRDPSVNAVTLLCYHLPVRVHYTNSGEIKHKIYTQSVVILLCVCFCTLGRVYGIRCACAVCYVLPAVCTILYDALHHSPTAVKQRCLSLVIMCASN